jgi:hypothetical protein
LAISIFLNIFLSLMVRKDQSQTMVDRILQAKNRQQEF